jgi:flagella basal body P-ring formation protein FlgA
LVEEKSQLLKRVASLQNSNAKLHEKITSYTVSVTESQDQQVSNHISQSEIKPQEEKVPCAKDSTATKINNKNNEKYKNKYKNNHQNMTLPSFATQTGSTSTLISFIQKEITKLFHAELQPNLLTF